ncbi:SitI3 family protein [Glycomyces sp. NPDC047010]|uniref:SitI3 family protein n=1 Tax=Glycomyces sp. NPDC047010 TaxID=3155023 RepID=UPI0034041934
MSIEYNLIASSALPERAALEYLAKLLACDREYSDPDGVARGSELRVGVLRTSVDHDPEMSELLGGVTEILTLFFHPSKFLTEDHDARIFAELMEAAAQFFEDFPQAKGLFTFQGEEIYLQRLGEDGIILDERLSGPDYNRDGVLDALLAKYTVREIDQVLL